MQPHALDQTLRDRIATTDRLHGVAQPRLEVIALTAVDALAEVGLDHRHLVRRELAVEVRLQVALNAAAQIEAHSGSFLEAWFANACLSARRPRCSRLITVPIGTPRMSAASW